MKRVIVQSTRGPPDLRDLAGEALAGEPSHNPIRSPWVLPCASAGKYGGSFHMGAERNWPPQHNIMYSFVMCLPGGVLPAFLGPPADSPAEHRGQPGASGIAIVFSGALPDSGIAGPPPPVPRSSLPSPMGFPASIQCPGCPSGQSRSVRTAACPFPIGSRPDRLPSFPPVARPLRFPEKTVGDGGIARKPPARAVLGGGLRLRRAWGRFRLPL
jgi:hypothetical protein